MAAVENPELVSALSDDVCWRVASCLDKRRQPNWRTIIDLMGKDVYSRDKIEEFGMASLKPRGSPTLKLLTDMGRRQVTVSQLTGWLATASKQNPELGRLVDFLNSGGKPLVVLEHPQSCKVMAGDPFQLTCKVEGNNAVRYQWFKESQPIRNCTGPVLQVERSQPEHGGKYICQLTSNGQNATFSRWCVVEVVGQSEFDVMFVPIVTMHPRARHVCVGQTTSLYCDAVGNPAPTFSWFKDDVALPGCTDRHLMIKSASEDDAGMYQCVACNKHGDVKSFGATLTVTKPHMNFDKVPGGRPLYEGRGPDSFDECVSMADNQQCRPRDKVALLIGNERYDSGDALGRLIHPCNDTRDVGAVLSSIGFKTVTLVNLTKQEMLTAIRLFVELLDKNVYAVFYFAGHGFEVNGDSFLMPVDASASYAPSESVLASDVLRSMVKCKTSLNLLLLDCCRTTPQSCCRDPLLKMTAEQVTGVQHGNVVIGFGCCAQGRVLESPVETNGFFASHLVKNLSSPLIVDEVLFNVAKGIHRDKIIDPATGRAQVVYRHSTLVDDVSLCDPILPSVASAKTLLWRRAHQAPRSPVTVFQNQHVKVSFAFTAEFSNVLLIHSSIESTQDTSECVVNFLLPSSLGGATIEVLEPGDKSVPSCNGNGSIVRVASVQRVIGELTIHIEVIYRVANGDMQRQRAFYSITEPPLYAQVLV